MDKLFFAAIAFVVFSFAALIDYGHRDLPYDNALGYPEWCVGSPVYKPRVGDTLYFCSRSSRLVGKWASRERVYKVIKEGPAIVTDVRGGAITVKRL